MTTAALSAPTPVQVEPANFLNLLIVDDERAVRESAARWRSRLASTRGADSATMLPHARHAGHRCRAAGPAAARRSGLEILREI